MNLKEMMIVTPKFNFTGSVSMAANYRRFMEVMKYCGVDIVTVECAFGDQPFEVTELENIYHVRVRTVDELFIKENLINIGIRHIRMRFPEVKYILWVDCDCAPTSPPREWMEKTWEALQHFEVVQMWEWLIDLGPDGQAVSCPYRSFMANFEKYGYVIPDVPKNGNGTFEAGYGKAEMGGPGLAWGASVSALDKIGGGLLDINILGSSDWWTAHALVNLADPHAIEMQLSNYGRAILRWQARAVEHIKMDVGYVRATLYHWWHGDKKDRQYSSRGYILFDHGFDPEQDLKYNTYGVLCLETVTPRQVSLRNHIRLHIQSRNDDSTPLRDIPHYQGKGQ